MIRRQFLQQAGLLAGAALVPTRPWAQVLPRLWQPLVQGRISSAGKGLAGIAISDGYQVVQTNQRGQYELQPHSNAQFVFPIWPAGYQFPHQQGIASFYRPIPPNTSRQQFDFELEALAGSDDHHAFIIWGDTQILDQADARQLVEVSAPATRRLVEQLGELPLHGIAVGDLVYDMFDLYPDYKAAVAKTGIPFFQVIGNHDMDLGARSDEQSQRTYCSHFGPTWYSFNRGKIHYVVLDDVFMHKTNRGYLGYLPEAQLAWLEQDLALVPAGSTVVVCLHIPTKTGAARRAGQKEESPAGSVSNRDVLYNMLKPYNAHLMSAHTHVNENWVEGNLMEHNHGTVCGAWWSGPVCSDGCPPGFAVYHAQGSQLSWQYHATDGGAALQLRLYAKGKSTEKPNSITANVWNWDPTWKVEWWQDGEAMGAMERFTGKDPLAVELYTGPKLPARHGWVEPSLTEHLFAAIPADGAKQVLVKATDRFGEVYTQSIDV